MQLSLGKQRGLRAISDERGIIAALAVDQRSALRILFAKASGLPAEGVVREQLVQFKELVSRMLTPDKSIRGRLPALLEDFSVARLEHTGADAVKVLLYYSPFSIPEINRKKHAWVEQIGAECLAAEIPFLLELVSYNDDVDEKSADFARIKPETVVRSIEEFCKPGYAADVLKIGFPVNMTFVESPGVSGAQALYSRAEARAHFRRASQAATLPFIYLSEGISNETFVEALDIAAEAGSVFSGVLCGRAIWQEGVAVFVNRGAAALEDWLCEHGVRNIQTVNAHLAAAHPWFEKLSAVSSGNR